MTTAQNQWKGQRDFWLDHYLQNPNIERRHQGPIRESDYIGVPITPNMPTPLAKPCLIWRWALSQNGYGTIDGRGAHIIAYEQSRNCTASPKQGDQIDHLCHRRACIQPAHLYLGDAKTNAEDRKALWSESSNYETWGQIGNRFDKAMTENYWPAPQLEGQSPGFAKPLECPHDFEVIKSAGSAQICLNCGEINEGANQPGHRDHCKEIWEQAPTCRCEPCCCRLCLQTMLPKAQQEFEKTGGWPIHSLGGEIPESLFDEKQPLDNETAQRARKTLEMWTGTQQSRRSSFLTKNE